MDLERMQREILDEMVPVAVTSAADAAALADHRDLLLGMEDDLVKGFYDTLYDHGATAAVFGEGERADRERTLRHWWQRTVEGPLDEHYWAWMALVGIVHIRRGVRNPMMLSMVEYVEDSVEHLAADAGLPEPERALLRRAFRHVGATVSAVISESYTQSYVGALQNLGGLSPRLLANMLDIEVQALEDAGRASLRTNVR